MYSRIRGSRQSGILPALRRPPRNLRNDALDSLMCLPRCIRLGPGGAPEGRTSSSGEREREILRSCSAHSRRRSAGNKTARDPAGILWHRAHPIPSPPAPSPRISHQRRLEGKEWEEDRRSLPVCPSNDRLKLHYVRPWFSRDHGVRSSPWTAPTWTGKGFGPITQRDTSVPELRGRKRRESRSSTSRNWRLSSLRDAGARSTPIVRVAHVPLERTLAQYVARVLDRVRCSSIQCQVFQTHTLGMQ